MDRTNAARAMGQAKSEAKTSAARANGRKGGFPKGGHRHRVATSREAGFSGPVAWPENPAAHGNITEIDACACGAERRTNINQIHVERGRWQMAETDGEGDYRDDE